MSVKFNELLQVYLQNIRSDLSYRKYKKLILHFFKQKNAKWFEDLSNSKCLVKCTRSVIVKSL